MELKNKRYVEIGIFLLILFICKSIYTDSVGSYYINFDSVDNKIEYQIFWATEKAPNFSEQNSVKYITNGDGINFKHNKIEIVSGDPITMLRLDFGKEPSIVKIKNVTIEGEKIYEITNEEIVKGLNQNVDKYDIKDDYLEIQSVQRDPFSRINIVTVNPKYKYKVNYFLLAIFSIIIFIMLNIISYVLTTLGIEIGLLKAIFILIILGIITTPIFFINRAEIDTEENRRLATFPKFYVNSSLNLHFISDFETWFNDRFGLRKYYIAVDNLVGSAFQSNRLENDKGFLGKEDWLFTKEAASIRNYQGINLYQEKNVNLMKEILVERNEWFKSQGIQYYIFIPPDKHRIYGEYYPDYIKKVSENSKLKQLKNVLADTDIKIIDPYDELMDKKNENLLYYKSDTHWNELGAFYGYETIMDYILKDFDEIEKLNIENYSIENKETSRNDLGALLKYESDNVTLYPSLIPMKSYNYETIQDNSESVITSNDEKNLKVMVFRDSFTTAMVPYLSETFGEVEYLSYKSINDEQDRIIKGKPDVVIEESVERLIDRIRYNTPALQEVK